MGTVSVAFLTSAVIHHFQLRVLFLFLLELNGTPGKDSLGAFTS